MKLFNLKWKSEINSVLEKEDETWICYLLGQKIESFPHLKNKTPRLQGSYLRILVSFLRLIKNTCFAPKPNPTQFLVYAGSKNQQDALNETISVLKEQKRDVLAITNPKQYGESAQRLGYRKLYFSPIDVAKTVILLISRHKSLRGILNGKSRVLSVNKLDSFCDVYSYLVYFQNLLRDSQPDYIIVSNDHNVPNRALLAIADEKGIDTVYMQHASVSFLFPALNVKYAFLDGQAAADIYQQCEANHPPGKPPRTDRRIFLSGQKKILQARPQSEIYSMGIALNKLDNPENVNSFLTLIKRKGLSAKVRCHPGLKDRELKPYMKVLKNHPHITKSDPKKEPVSDFLGSIKALISGNSSIHLEAALSNVVPVYYEFTHADTPDYYGYVKHGVAVKAKDIHELAKLLKSINDGQTTISTAAVQRFSATYGTEWEGREGEFVVRQLLIEQHKKQASEWIPPNFRFIAHYRGKRRGS